MVDLRIIRWMDSLDRSIETSLAVIEFAQSQHKITDDERETALEIIDELVIISGSDAQIIQASHIEAAMVKLHRLNALLDTVTPRLLQQ